MAILVLYLRIRTRNGFLADKTIDTEILASSPPDDEL